MEMPVSERLTNTILLDFELLVSPYCKGRLLSPMGKGGWYGMREQLET